jgi:hypothetical protein
MSQTTITITASVLYSVPVTLTIPSAEYANMQNPDIAEAMYREANAALLHISMQRDARYIVRCNDDEINDTRRRFH